MKHDLLIERRKIIVRAKIKGINDVREFKFFLDTGASITVIDEDAVFRLGFDIKRLKTGDRLMTAGGGMYLKILKLPKLNLFGKEMVNFEVNVLKISSANNRFC